MRRPLCAALLVLALAGCGGGSDDEPASASTATSTPTPDMITVAGTMTLNTGQSTILGEIKEGSDCVGDGGYTDIRAGAQVVVRGATGQTVAIGDLESGVVAADASCVFDFSIADVPGTEAFYTVEVSHRGELNYSRAEVEQPLAFVL